ncbi:universal stress protein [Flavobacteriaceae bacterium F89]|uniref:Universal stress protein n=1 Tax=Cerina litoralis TaxID=2874477 RepID=A0AAE3ET93_9FLAO|nr:universal stress protein [Cerina litoralis]MCG2460023.1 universal stress protein [Cerina litoralis]
MKKILVPVDFSESSENALEVAATLAKKHNAEILVLHMLGLSEAVITKDATQEFFEAKYYLKLAKKRFDMFLDRPWLKDIKITQTVQNYIIFGEINNVAKERDIDLIVMGSHGTSGLSDIFVGSNTEKVVRTSEVPVLVIKERSEHFKLRSMVFGYDFEQKSLQAYKNLLSFCEVLQVDLHLVYVNLHGVKFLSSEEMKEKINEFYNFANLGKPDAIPQVTYICDYSVEKGIYYHAEEIDADAITVITNGRSGLAHFFKGSIGEKIANRASLPVLTLKV